MSVTRPNTCMRPNVETWLRFAWLRYRKRPRASPRLPGIRDERERRPSAAGPPVIPGVRIRHRDLTAARHFDWGVGREPAAEAARRDSDCSPS